jgi:uncharacterized protein (TIGR00290 family)
MLPTCLHWSSGKDAALALYLLSKDPTYKITQLVTIMVVDSREVGMHKTHERLLDLQAESIGLPLIKVAIPENAPLTTYTNAHSATYQRLRETGIENAAFGDIFLEDLRTYREKQLQKSRLKALFPLWKKDTTHLMHQFIDLGFKAVISCVNTKYLDTQFLGKTIDAALLEKLPPQVDPCGEHGEFHTFVYDGPIFKFPIPFTIGNTTKVSYAPPSQTESESAHGWDTQFTYLNLLPHTKSR